MRRDIRPRSLLAAKMDPNAQGPQSLLPTKIDPNAQGCLGRVPRAFWLRRLIDPNVQGGRRRREPGISVVLGMSLSDFQVFGGSRDVTFSPGT